MTTNTAAVDHSSHVLRTSTQSKSSGIARRSWRTASDFGSKARCPACDGSGWVFRVDDETYPGLTREVACRCPDPAGIHAAEQVGRLARISGLEPEELEIGFEHISQRGGDGDLEGLALHELARRENTAAMLEVARRFVFEPWGFLTFWGGYGNAKTLMLQAIVNECRRRYNVVGTYVRMVDLLEWIRSGYDEGATMDARERYERLKGLDLLAIDEVDKARMTEFAAEFRTAFLDDRYRLAVLGKAHTLFAMNAPPEELPGDVYDRLRDGRFVIMHNADRSMRPAMVR